MAALNRRRWRSTNTSSATCGNVTARTPGSGRGKRVYARPAGAKADIAAELRGITDIDARNSAPMILDVVQDAEQAKAALAAAFDDPAVSELRVFNLGDGGAMSGILVAGRLPDMADATFLVFLLD
ncbi:MAG: hypothetical protein R2844_14300 [Caldilineales bacterium]